MKLASLFHAQSYFEARLLQGLLEGEGLHPVLPGGDLNDEFGMAQKLSGGAAEVFVPETELEPARKILEVWKQGPRE